MNRKQFLEKAAEAHAASPDTPVIIPAFNAEMIGLFIDDHITEFKAFCISKAMFPVNGKALRDSLRGAE